MKKLLLPLMLVAIILGLYEQTKAQPNVYILTCTIVVFMYGMMKLSAKTLHHDNQTKEEQHTDDTEDDSERR